MSSSVLLAGPIRAASIAWPATGSVVVICKATYRLAPGVCAVAEELEGLYETDSYWDDDPARSLAAASDFLPDKPRPEILLVGYAYAREPVRSVVARVIVGMMDKAVEVFCDRAFMLDGSLREGPRFRKMPLRYERAAGGRDTSNPVGIESGAPPNARGERMLPNLQPPGGPEERPDDFIVPTGFGPIAPSWPSRRDRVGPRTDAWAPERFHEGPLPEGFDPKFFQSAPWDQEVDELRADERIILENLHPSHPRLVTRLVGLQPRAYLDTGVPVALRADTLTIDTERLVCTLVWRGRVAAPPTSRILVAVERPNKSLSFADVQRLLGNPSGPQPFDPDAATPLDPGATAPYDAGATVELRLRPRKAARDSSAALEDPETEDVLLPGLPFARSGAARPAPPVRPPIAPSPWAAAGASPAHSPLGGSSQGPPAPSPVLPFAEPSQSGPTSVSPASLPAPSGALRDATSEGEHRVVPAARPSAPRSEAGRNGHAPSSVLDASNAAVNRPPAPTADASTEAGGRLVQAEAVPAPADSASARGRAFVKLLWSDAASTSRLRRNLELRRHLLAFDLDPARADEDDEHPKDAAERVRDAARVLAVMTHAAPLDAKGLRAAFAEGLRDGVYAPRTVLLEGDISTPFDELERLKATVTAVTPLAAGDRKLGEVIESVTQLLGTPWVENGRRIAARLTERLREVFSQGKRILPLDALELHVERALLEQRHYQRRKLHGAEWVRAILTLGTEAVPVYLPLDAAERLPLYRTFRGRVLAEVDAPEDEEELAPISLRVMALGRMVSPPT